MAPSADDIRASIDETGRYRETIYVGVSSTSVSDAIEAAWAAARQMYEDNPEGRDPPSGRARVLDILPTFGNDSYRVPMIINYG